MPEFDTTRINAQLRRWQERLLDLTKRNPLLGLNRSLVSKLRVAEPPTADLFNRFVLDEEDLRMPLVRRKAKARAESEESAGQPVDDEYEVEQGDISFDAKPPELLKRLRRVFDNARTTVEERGVTTLHLTLGVLRWEAPALGESFSPLWLVPCQFEYSGPSAALRLQRADEEMQVNPALELYLRERHRVSLPPLPEELTQTSLTEYLDRVREVVAERGWTVVDDAWLSTFSFESLVIYQDLKVMAEAALVNPIVSALARAGTVSEGSEALGETLDDLPTPDRVPVPVLPTDASQLRALTLAAGGRNIVIHGPPGTGKSQTISNLIADALGRRQTVLFVSAKMAALDVVYGRLAERGLARFCLEAHSTKAGKVKIIEELKRTLETTGDGGADSLGEQLDELRKVRGVLNDYVVELHRHREPLGLSVYQAIGLVSKLHSAPTVSTHALPWEDLLAVSRADLRAAIDILDELAAQAEVYDNRRAHPWRGFALPPESIVREDRLEQALTGVARFVEGLMEPFKVLDQLLGVSPCNVTIDAAHALLPGMTALVGCDRLPLGWHTCPIQDLEESATLLEKAMLKAKSLKEATAALAKDVKALAHEWVALLAPMEQEYRSWTRSLKPGFYRWRTSVRNRLTPGAPAKLPALRSYVDLATRIIKDEEWLKGHDPELARLAGPGATRDPATLAKAAKEHRASRDLRAAMDEHGLVGSGSSGISSEIKTASLLLCQAIVDPEPAKSIGYVAEWWPGGFVDGTPVARASLPSLLTRCQEVTAAFPRLHEWTLLCHTLARCHKAGLSAFVEALGRVSVRQAPAAFERRFYTLWVVRTIEGARPLQLFSPERRAERTERFRQLDDKVRRSALAHVKAVASAPARNISSAQTSYGAGGEVGTLRRELQKQKRIKPLRKLFAEIPRALQALKPCMLMSPLSVSTFLKPGSISFDLVVFDEASQLPTPQAIPSILRANQVVVAGDEKQLPPTSFFEASVVFDDEADNDLSEELEPLESLLNECVAINPVFLPTSLTWHYRSRDERLINFSNHYFYNNSLVTFPSATTSSLDRGVRHVLVQDGMWDRGRSRTNRREARRVAELVVEQFERFPDRSLGVVAMNTTQREAIEISLNELIEERPALSALLAKTRPEPFFIKALENVQGDERDTMLISMGYAKTAAGALSLNFGPLNRDGGWRRLNVLVTRAKWQTIMVTSVRSGELSAVQPSNRGAFMLRKFIEYAEQEGILPPDPAEHTRAETNDFEEAVAEALRQSGLQIDEQVGVGAYRIDLAVRDPRDTTRYLLGIECDGATYHSARTARDRDLLRQQVLRDQGWRVHRLWSTEWFRDREKALQSALRSVEQAMRSGTSASVDAPPAEGGSAPPPGSSRQKAAGAPSPEAARKYGPGQPYRRYHPPRTRGSEGIMDGSRLPELATQITAVVRTEAPIHEVQLLDRLKEIYGFARAGGNIQDNIRRAIALAVRQHGLQHDSNGHFLYSGKGSIDCFRVDGDGVERSIDQLPPEEIELAILFVVEDRFGFSRDRLPRAIVDTFGLGKANSGVSEIVGDIVDGLIESGRLRLSGTSVYLP